jgi:chromosome segregation ATPase
MADNTVADTIIEANEAVTDAANADAAANVAQAAETAVATAQTVQALATVTAATAEQQAAETIAEKEEELEWLRQHATQTESSLANQTAEVNHLKQGQATIMEMLSKATAMMESLTPREPSQLPAEAPVIQPENQNPNAGVPQDGQNPPATAEKKKPGKRWI